MRFAFVNFFNLVLTVRHPGIPDCGALFQPEASDWAACVVAAASSSPPCEDYIETIGRYVREFGGGPGAPIVHFLDHVGKSFGENKIIGREMWEAVTLIDIPSDRTKFAFTRAACIAPNLASAKVVDGFARFILPAQIEALKKFDET